MCNFSSHSRSGWTTLYHIYRLVMGSWRQTGQTDLRPGLVWHGPRGCCPPDMEPCSPRTDHSLAHSHRRLGLKPLLLKVISLGLPLPRGSRMPQSEPPSSQPLPAPGA